MQMFHLWSLKWVDREAKGDEVPRGLAAGTGRWPRTASVVCGDVCPRVGVGVCASGLFLGLDQPVLRQRLFSLLSPQCLCKLMTLATRGLWERGWGWWRMGPQGTLVPLVGGLTSFLLCSMSY